MRQLKVVALDPGGTTGWASAEWERFKPFNPDLRHYGPGSHHGELAGALTNFKPDVVVCEDFRYRQQANAILVSVEYIGVVKLFVHTYRTTLLVMQGADVAHGSGVWDDNKLKKASLWLPNRRHAMDALIHLLHFLTVNKKGPQDLSILEALLK
jgi:hypothetical protein